MTRYNHTKKGGRKMRYKKRTVDKLWGLHARLDREREYHGSKTKEYMSLSGKIARIKEEISKR